MPMLFLLVFYYSLNKVKSIFSFMLITPVSNVGFKADIVLVANFVKAFYNCRKINMGKSWHFSIVIGKVHVAQKRAGALYRVFKHVFFNFHVERLSGVSCQNPLSHRQRDKRSSHDLPECYTA